MLSFLMTIGNEEDRAFMAALYRKHQHFMLRIARKYTNNHADAEDVVQEVFLKLLTGRPAFRDAEHEKAWLIRVTLNRAADIRRKRRHVTLSLDEVKEQAKNDNTSVVLPAIRSLPHKYSAVLHLYYYEGYNTEEIAKMLAMPKGTVTTRLSRGRNMLKDILKED